MDLNIVRRLPPLPATTVRGRPAGEPRHTPTDNPLDGREVEIQIDSPDVHQVGHRGERAEVDNLTKAKANRRKETRARAKDGTTLEDLADHHLHPSGKLPLVQLGRVLSRLGGIKEKRRLLTLRRGRNRLSLSSSSWGFLLS